MATVYLYNKEYEKGKEVLKDCAEKASKSDDYESAGIAYSNLANFHRETNDLDSAIIYQKKAITAQKKCEDLEHLAITYANLGSNLALQQKFEEGLSYLDLAYKIMSKEKESGSLAFLYIEYSKIHLTREDFSQAKTYANLSLEIARKISSVDMQSRAFNELARISYVEKDFELSTEYLLQQMVLQNSIYQALQSERVRETSALFGVFEAEKKTEYLAHEIELEKSRYMLVLSISIFVSVLLAFMVFLWFRIRAKNKVLFEQSIKGIPRPKEKIEIEPEESEKYKLLYNQILKQFESEKLYLDSTLTMGALSDLIKSNSNYVSKSINMYFGSNFNSMINFYRVNEAKKMIEGGSLTTFTMETVAKNCGFTSLSVFNRSFKKETGIPPTYFYKSLNSSTKK